MPVILKDSGNNIIFEFPSGCELVEEPFTKRLGTEPRVHAHGGVITADRKIEARIISLHGIWKEDTQALMETKLKSMKKAVYTENLRLYSTQFSNDFYNVECLNFEQNFLGFLLAVEVNIDFLVSGGFRYYKDLTTDTHYLSNCLSLTGAGYASIADGSQKGLDMGYSDFMGGIWIKTSSTAIFPIIYKGGVGGYYDLHLNATTGYLECKINDGTNTATITGDVALNDAKWHLVRFSIDKSSATGGRLYADGVEDTSARTDVSSVLDIDNDGVFYIGYDGSNYGTGKYDELEVWNFGLNGLPADIADYDTWRYANPHAALSSYDSGAWNGYADADRTELITLGDLDDDNGDFEGAGADGTDIETNTDWNKTSTSAETDNEAGSGVNTYNGSNFCCKIHTASDDHPRIALAGADFDAAFTVGKWYEVSYDYKVLDCTTAKVRVVNAGDELDEEKALTSTSWTTDRFIFQVVDNTDMVLQVFSHVGTDETGNEVVWIDNISIKRCGLVAHWKLADYSDETTNGNDLSAGGAGNTFPLASLIDSTVNNAGDIEVFPVITFTAGVGASISKIAITNVTDAGKSFEYTPAASLVATNIVEVDCQKGTVELNTGAGLADDIAHWSGRFIRLLSGNNDITIAITGTVGTNQCVFAFRHRWL